MLLVDSDTRAYQLIAWAGPPLVIVMALGLVLWGVLALRHQDRGLVRIIVGVVVAGVAGAGLAVQVADAIAEAAPAAASAAPTATAAPRPTAPPLPSTKPGPAAKFTPKPIPDPGPGTRYAGCRQSIDAYNAARFEVIKRSRIAWVDGAMSALLSGQRAVIANARCFEDDVVAAARSITLKTLNEAVPPRIQSAPPQCQQTLTDAYRLVGLASGFATVTDGDVDLGPGIDALQRRDPTCITQSDAEEMKKLLAEQLPADS